MASRAATPSGTMRPVTGDFDSDAGAWPDGRAFVVSFTRSRNSDAHAVASRRFTHVCRGRGGRRAGRLGSDASDRVPGDIHCHWAGQTYGDGPGTRRPHLRLSAGRSAAGDQERCTCRRLGTTTGTAPPTWLFIVRRPGSGSCGTSSPSSGAGRVTCPLCHRRAVRLPSRGVTNGPVNSQLPIFNSQGDESWALGVGFWR